ncbi:MAG: transposase, partial [Bacteroidales bacterium]|nr:transposase [Bacteroidales bacterium]
MAKKGRYRVFKAGALHHIYQRTYDGYLIFYSVRDFLVFFTLFCTIARKYHIRVLGICLMYDHIHVLVAAPSKKDLSAFVQEYTCRFARQRNVQYQRKGSFFQRRFGSAPKSGEKKARTAIAYLYNNPV